MAKWSRSQIELMARSAGWGKRSADVSWVAMAESSGDSSVVNGIGAVGLLQINQPVHVASHPKWTVKWLQDPINNLSAGLVLFKAAGNSFDPDWGDSKNKGGIPEGWGPHVKGGSTGASQASDSFGSGDPLEDWWNKLLGNPKRGPGSPDWQGDPFNLGIDLTGLQDTATQLGRMAQAIAKAGNWLSDPANWVRIAYVTGGSALLITAVSVVVKPYIRSATNTVAGALPTRALTK